MRSAKIFRSCVSSGFAATLIGLSLPVSPATAAEMEVGWGATVQLVQSQCGTLGPFATIRRANEVANQYRDMGCMVYTPYHNGDGYYVSGCC